MSVARETPGELSGREGKTYRPSTKGVTELSSFCGSVLLEGEEELAFVELPARLRSSRGETTVKAQLKFGDARFNGLKKHVSLPVDAAYRNGEFVGLIVTHMHRGVSLSRYLDFSRDARSERRRVAYNLAVQVCVASQLGVPLGRLSPDRIRVDSTTCRVFLAADWVALMEESCASRQAALSLLPWQRTVDFAVCEYSLLRKKSAPSLSAGLWEGDCSGLGGPSDSDMVATAFDAVKKPWFARVVARFDKDTPLLSRLWDAPRPFRSLLEHSFRSMERRDAGILATEMIAYFDRGEKYRRSGFSVWKDRLKQFLNGARVPAEQVKEFERRPWGLRGYGNAVVFWLVTLGMAAALGLCSAMNGFAPLDLLVVALRGADYAHSAINMGWRYGVAAVLGCAAYNLFVAQRHCFSGYGRKSYCWSVATAVLFMSLAQFLMIFSLRGGIS